MSKLETKLINFEKAIARLKEAIDEYKQEDSSKVVRDGLIQRFEFTYELAWKTTKVYLEQIGIVDRNSPKAVIQEAYLQKLITNEENWILMIKDRNLTSHVYDEDMAEEIADRIADTYIVEFESLYNLLENL